MELKDISGIGPKTEEALNSNNIFTANDLLYYFPRVYSIFEIDNNALKSGELTTIMGNLTSAPYFIKYRANVNAVILYLNILGETVKCVLFSSDYLRYKLFKGSMVMLYGKYDNNKKEFLARRLFIDKITSRVECDYKLKNVKNGLMAKAIRALFNNGLEIKETLPLELINKYRLLPIYDYLYKSHFPNDKRDCREVLRRRKYEEFFWYATRLNLLKSSRFEAKKPKRAFDNSIIEGFINSLPYRLTEDQLSAIELIKGDILGDYPMNRLVQGDVGCGKSIVATIAALMEVKASYQVAIMVPTEILAMQQYKLIKELLAPYEVEVELLTSSIRAKDKDDILFRLLHNRINIIIGTHALIEDKVIFNRLGLAIIDEQHRFGVAQRRRLITKFPKCDTLYLTATPIPRSLGLTVFGDLDIASIKAMPSGRSKIDTKIIDSRSLRPLYKAIENHIRAGEQAYVVVPLVDMNDELNRIDINEAYAMLTDNIKNARIGMLHGKLKAKEKNDIMNEFKNGRIDILVSTTVIEVGVNVPNATIMVILNAECFGLAQLHQLRGRVGRGSLQGHCALVSSDINNPRLKILEETLDGFKIAEEDFRLRGPGDYLGSMQSGYNNLDYADFNLDFNIWSCAKEDSIEYLNKFIAGEAKSSVFDGIILENKRQKLK